MKPQRTQRNTLWLNFDNTTGLIRCNYERESVIFPSRPYW